METSHAVRSNNGQVFTLARLRIVTISWIGAVLFFTALLEISESGHKQLGFALYSNAIHFALWALALPLLAICIKRFPLKTQNRLPNIGIRVVLITVLAPLVAVLDWAILFSTWFPYRSFDRTFSAVLRNELPRFLTIEILIGIIIVTGVEAWQVLKDLQLERMRALDLERQLAVSRLEALRMQLHPHFLFNTLHAVAGLTTEDPPTARRMVIALGDFLRNTLKDTGDQVRTLAEELEYSDLYLGIEKLRFGDRLVLNYDMEPSVTRALVPQFLLLPLFENAIRHGAGRMTGPCEIRFSAVHREDKLDLRISNDGPKRDTSIGPPPFGVGLSNTSNRLQIHYADRHSFRYSDQLSGGAIVEISIPYAVAGHGPTSKPSTTRTPTIEIDAPPVSTRPKMTKVVG